MSKTKKIAILAIIAMVLTMIPASMFAATADDTRLAGADRYGTAIEIAGAGWSSASTVILAPANTNNLVDALAAAPLAGKENAPILVTDINSLNADVKAKIAALKATKVYVVGAVSADVAAAVDAMDGVTVERLSGADRWATADAINAKLSPAGTFVVGYNAVADAMSVASFAAANNYKIVLAKADGSVDSAKVSGKVYIVGGPTLVKDITGATRLYGADRFATNTDVASKLNYSYSRVYVANGISLVDALAVAPLAAKYKAFVALASASNVNAVAGANAATKIVAVGGTGVVSDAVAGKVYVPSASLSVASVTATDLNQIVVTFTQPVDETSAETPGNYVLGGADLTNVNAFDLSLDKKTLTINLNAPKGQYEKAIFKVKGNAVYGDKAASTVVPVYSQELTFSDTAVPTVKAVTVKGNKQLTVEFSEPVKMVSGGGGFAAIAGTKFKIDGQYLTNYGFSTATALNATTGKDWANKIQLSFATAIPAGAHTLTTLAGDVTNLFDAAKFKVALTTTDFTVAAVTGAPTLVSVEGENNGTIYVTYDRSMGASALTIASYRMNGALFGGSTVASFKEGTNDTVVKFTGVAGVAKGANVVTVLKNTVMDAYGNKLNADADTRVSFNATDDTTKPYVTSVTALSNTKVRVKFSEPIAAAYGTNLSNYTLKDNTGATVTLTVVPSMVGADTVDLTTPALTGSNYSLTIKNVVDRASIPNKMEDYTATFNGIDDVAPTVTEALAQGNAQKVAVLFSESMDAATITNTANYLYIDNAAPAVTRALPSGTTVVAGADNKSVEITFPSAYTVNGGAATEYSVINLIIGNVKDVAGNTLQNISVSTATLGNIKAAGTGTVKPDYVAKTFNLSASTGKVTAEFELDQNITNLKIADFRVGGKLADTGYISGKKIILEFTDTATPGDIAAIKALGNAATLTCVSQTSTNIYGTTIAAFAAKAVHDNKIAPELTGVAAGTDAKKINLTFSMPIDQTILGLYKDDFIVESAGQVHKVTSVDANGANGLTLNLETSISGDATVKADASAISIKSIALDGAKTAEMYDPVAADKDGSKTAVDGFGPVATAAAGATLVLTYDEALYIGGAAVAHGTDIKAQYTPTGTATITSATYNASAKTVTFVLAGLADGDVITAAATLTDIKGTAVSTTTDVATYTLATTTWALN